MRLIALWGAAVLCAGCRDTGSDDAIELAALPREMAIALCEQLAQCCTAGELDQVTFGQDDCVEAWVAFMEEEADFVDIRASVAAGTTRYDAAQGARCVEHIRGMSCAGVSAFIVEEQVGTGLACLDMLAGTQPVGATCTESYQCTTGVCGATCEPALEAGAACGSSCEDRFECRRCEGSMLCDPETQTCMTDPPVQAGPYCDGV